MTPVHPIETSGGARRSHERRTNAWRRGPVFQLPGDVPAASDLAVHSVPPTQNVAVLAQTAGGSFDATAADQASQAFVDNVSSVMRTPQRITGWFVDLIV
ncbi:MAG TPA: hypothetical protein VMH36_22075 [Alphaproteobacteria bacterium]|nr:hypothetical protein [Alphaproteobacteria bacterium]